MKVGVNVNVPYVPANPWSIALNPKIMCNTITQNSNLS